MLFADDTGTWIGVAAMAVTGLLGFLGTLAKLRHDEDIAVLKRDNADLRSDHASCQTRLTSLEAHQAAAEAETQRQRDVKHDLGNFVTVLFGELYAVGVKPEKLEELRNKYLAIMDRGRPRLPPTTPK